MSPRVRRGALAALLAVMLAAVAGSLAGPVRQRLRARRLSRELDRLVAVAQGRRWERPVLRGGTLEGNAAEAAQQAVRALGDISQVSTIGPLLREGQPLPADVVDLVHTHEADLRVLRDASRRGWAHWAPDYSRGEDRPEVQYSPHVKAAKLLLAQAAISSPGECLRICADVVRLAGDLAPQSDLVALMITTVNIGLVVPVAMRCAMGASPDERAQGAREFEVLAASPPPFGETFWVDRLLSAATLRAQERALPWFPASRAGRAAFDQRAMLLDTWEYLLRELARPFEISGTEYPDSFVVLEDLMDERQESAVPLVVAIGSGFPRYMHRDAQAQVHVRAVALALALLATLPPGAPLPAVAPASVVERRALRDPFTGHPLHWRLAPDGASATVYSLGLDRVDDGAAAGSDDIPATLRR